VYLHQDEKFTTQIDGIDKGVQFLQTTNQSLEHSKMKELISTAERTNKENME
jgi:hypothetical protein